MRCKNCGWDNPDGNMSCEKCNAPIGGYMEENRAQNYHYAQNEFAPQATVVGGAFGGNHAGADSFQESFNPRATVIGCSACGYPIKPGDAECPVCGQPVAGFVKQEYAKQDFAKQEKQEEKVEKQEEKKPSYAGTMIQGLKIEGAKADEVKVDVERRKLTGFLVSYTHAPNGEFFPVYEGKNVIGRAASCNASIQGDSAVSERHVSILYRAVDRKFKFKDEQSSNGTFINGALIDEGELKNFDRIQVGNTSLVFIEIPPSAFEG